jgi:nucleotide-binding universal stress UspA family protein
MLETILVPLDGSPVSEVALPYAEALASVTGGRLILVRAAHAPAFHPEPEHEQFSRVETAEDYLAEIAQALVARGVKNVETAVPYGQAAAWIVDEAEMRHADIIVMSTHDRSGADRWLHGSVAESVVHQASVPVLLIRADNGAAGAALFAKDERAIVVPLDGSALAEAALPTAVDLARCLNGHLILVSVVPEPGDTVTGAAGLGVYVGDEHALQVVETDDYLSRMQAMLGRQGQAVDTLLMRGDPASEIGNVARLYGASAVVMATHGHTGLARAIVGSVAGKVLRACNSAVVLIRPVELRDGPAQAQRTVKVDA